jgi:hypothetical protein
VQVNLVDPTSMVAALEARRASAPTVATLHMRGEVRADLPAFGRRTPAAARRGRGSREFAALARDVLQVARPGRTS